MYFWSTQGPNQNAYFIRTLLLQWVKWSILQHADGISILPPGWDASLWHGYAHHSISFIVT